VHKLDAIREALRRGDIKAASRLGRVFTLTPVLDVIAREGRQVESTGDGVASGGA